MYGVFITPDTRQLLLLLLRVVLLSKFAPQSTGSSELQLTGSRAPSRVCELKLTAAHSWFAACTLLAGYYAALCSVIINMQHPITQQAATAQAAFRSSFRFHF
jgi:hypothetical protein